VPAKKYAYCNFCERLTEWIEGPEGWRCAGCGAIRSTEPEWSGRTHRLDGRIMGFESGYTPCMAKQRGPESP